MYGGLCRYRDGDLATSIFVQGHSERRRTKTRRLTRDQTRAIIEEIPAPYRDLVYLLATSVMRIGEAVSLTWSDLLRSPEGLLSIQIRKSKTESRVRISPLSPEAARMLLDRQEKADFRRDSDPMFVSSVERPLSPNNFRRRIFNPAAKRAGVPWATPHSLWHGLATRMIEHGHSPAHVAAQLGHADGGVLAMRTYAQIDSVNSMAFADEGLTSK